MEAKKEFYFNRILICVLLAASIVSLFLPWMDLHITVRGKNYTLEDLFIAKSSYYSSYYSAENRYRDNAVDQFKEEFYDDLERALDYNNQPSKVIKALKGVENGKITVLEYVNLLTLLPASFGALGAVILVIFILFVIALLVAIYIFGTGELIYNRKPLIPYMICCALIFFVAAISIGAVNKSIASTLHDNIVDMLWGFDLIDGNFSIRTSLLHLSYGGFLCIGFALAAYGATFLQDKKISLPNTGIGGWSCPACGESCRMNMAFCPVCGAEKPQPPRCTYCGRILKEGQRFCPGCGKENSQPMRCTNCGELVNETQRFCRNCGQAINAGEAPQQSE